MNTDKIFAEQIANQYTKKVTTKAKQLRKLDNLVKKGPRIFAYFFGILCTLLLGSGLCLSMKILGNTTKTFICGIIIGVVGIIGCSINYLLYSKMLEKNKEKYRNDILKLADDIIKE